MQRIHKSVLTKSRKYCSVPQCSCYCTKDTSLHGFPKEPKLRQRWKDVLKIGKPISLFMYVCSEHFLKEDFIPVTLHTVRKRLKKGVVPTQKLPVKPHDEPERKKHKPNQKCYFAENEPVLMETLIKKESDEIFQSLEYNDNSDVEDHKDYSISASEIVTNSIIKTETESGEITIKIEKEEIDIKVESSVPVYNIKVETVSVNCDEEKKLYNNNLKNNENKRNVHINKSNTFHSEDMKISNLESNPKSDNTDKEIYKCELCHFKCSYKHSLQRHNRTHTGEKPFNCKICKSSYSDLTCLTRHMRTHTGEKPYSCEICHFKTSRLSTIQRHKLVHTGERRFECELCHKKLTNKSDLQRHMRIHTGEKPFECDTCQFKFSRKSHLDRHMRMHSGEKPFTCAICNLKLADKRNLPRHMRIHSGEKPFECEICKHKCRDKVNLQQHMTTHTNEKPFNCKICDYKCARRGDLKRHMVTHIGCD